MRRNQDPAASLEDALRWLAVQHAHPLEHLEHALIEPRSKSAAALGLLLEPTASMPDPSSHRRALAIWGLMLDEVARIGPSDNSQRRNALRAAFRMQQRE